MTVHDNDFTQDIENFADGLFGRLCFCKDGFFESYADSLSKLVVLETKQELRKLLNPSSTQKLTQEDIVFIRGAVFLAWCEYLDEI